jgi:hypothetical protein
MISATSSSRVLALVLASAALVPLAASCSGTGDAGDSGSAGATSLAGSGGTSAAGKGGASGKGGVGGTSAAGTAGKGGGAGASGASGQAGAAGAAGGGAAGASGAAGKAGSAGGGAGGAAGKAGSGGVAGQAGGGAAGSAGSAGASIVFPTTPIIDPSVPAGGSTVFPPPSASDPGGGPCVTEPEPATLLPQNWLRPRFAWNAAAGENLFELRLITAGQPDLVVCTANKTWTMPATLWQSVAASLPGQKIAVSVRGGVWNGQTLTMLAKSNDADFTVAPTSATGSIVYWTTSNGTALKGFSVGDESTAVVLTPPQVKMPTSGGAAVTCIGCHTSTPDGAYAGMVAQGPWGNVLASVKPGASLGAPPAFLGAGAGTALGMGPLGIETFSKAHWTAGDHVEIAPLGDGPGNPLAWFDLEATNPAQGAAYGVIARNGDSRGVGAPAWSHDGKTIAYVSTNAEYTGRLDNGDADLYTVPYNNRMGGTATPVAGAADPGLEEYYPTYSADDALLAFNVVPSNTNMYNAPPAEVFVIPASGGQKTRLVANDPPACTGQKSPGITNSWPKWSPQATDVAGKKYYWLVFSSARHGNGPRLYMTGVVVDAAGGVQTHGAVFLWNQPDTENNHTPAWDVFDIKP